METIRSLWGHKPVRSILVRAARVYVFSVVGVLAPVSATIPPTDLEQFLQQFALALTTAVGPAVVSLLVNMSEFLTGLENSELRG